MKHYKADCLSFFPCLPDHLSSSSAEHQTFGTEFRERAHALLASTQKHGGDGKLIPDGGPEGKWTVEQFLTVALISHKCEEDLRS